MLAFIIHIFFLNTHSALAQESSDKEKTAEQVTSEEIKSVVTSPIFIIHEKDDKIDPEKLIKEVDINGVREKINIDSPKKITYFVEVRNQNKLSITRNPGYYEEVLGVLKSGYIIRIDDNIDGYLDKLRQERKGVGIFKKIPAYNSQDFQKAENPSEFYYVLDHFKTNYTISPFEQPINMSLNLPIGSNTLVLYKTPGDWDAQECERNRDNCVAWIDHYADLYLLDTKLVRQTSGSDAHTNFRIYYLVGYEYKLPNGEIKKGFGWANGEYFQRRIDRLATQMAAARMPSSVDFTLAADGSIKNLYVFGGNVKNTKNLNKFTGGMTESRARELASVWSIKLAFDGSTTISQTQLTQSWLDSPISFTGVEAQLGVAAPIFLDLEIRGSLRLGLPVAASSSQYKPITVKAEEWLEFATPATVSSIPFKVGLGGYYYTMLNTDGSYGINSLLGLQARLLYENQDFWTYFKYAPLGASLSFKSSNREIGVGLGYKVQSIELFKGSGFYGEYIDMSYISPSNNKSTIQQYNLGAFFSF